MRSFSDKTTKLCAGIIPASLIPGHHHISPSLSPIALDSPYCNYDTTNPPLVYSQLLANHNQARSAYWEVLRHHQRQQHYWHCQEVDEETEQKEAAEVVVNDKEREKSNSSAVVTCAESISSDHQKGSVSHTCASAVCTPYAVHTLRHRPTTRCNSHTAYPQKVSNMHQLPSRPEDFTTSLQGKLETSTGQSRLAVDWPTTRVDISRNRVSTVRRTEVNCREKNGPMRADHNVLSSAFTSCVMATWNSSSHMKYNGDIDKPISLPKEPHSQVQFLDENHNSDSHSDSPISPSLSSGDESGCESTVSVKTAPLSSRRYHRKRSLSSILKELVDSDTVRASTSGLPFPAKHPRCVRTSAASSISSEQTVAVSPAFLQSSLSTAGSIVTNPHFRRQSLGLNMVPLPISQSSSRRSSLLPAPLPADLRPQSPKVNHSDFPPPVAIFACSCDQSFLCKCIRRSSSGFIPSSFSTQSEISSFPMYPSVIASDQDPFNDSGLTGCASVSEGPHGNRDTTALNARRHKTKRRSSGSRQILESICRTAKRTIGNLRRAMSTDGLNDDDRSTVASSVTSGNEYSQQHASRRLLPRFPASLADSDFLCTRKGTGNFFPHEKTRGKTSTTPTKCGVVTLRGISKRHTSIRTPLDHPDISPPMTRSQSTLAVVSRFVEFHDDGTNTVKLVRPESGPFGFFVAKGNNGLYVSRMAVNCDHLNKTISVGDEILEIEGLSCGQMNLQEVHNAIGRRRNVTFKIRPCRAFI